MGLASVLLLLEESASLLISSHFAHQPELTPSFFVDQRAVLLLLTSDTEPPSTTSTPTMESSHTSDPRDASSRTSSFLWIQGLRDCHFCCTVSWFLHHGL